jgi:protein associated with RNAse G/E
VHQTLQDYIDNLEMGYRNMKSETRNVTERHEQMMHYEKDLVSLVLSRKQAFILTWLNQNKRSELIRAVIEANSLLRNGLRNARERVCI